MESKNNKVVNKKKYKYKSPNDSYSNHYHSAFLYILIEIVYIFYYLYKILPIYIKIVFWLSILGLCIWFVITVKNKPITTQPNPNP
jgi:hypothetical protein